MTLHAPMRPSWACAGCSQPWPCQTRRQQLLAEYADAPVSLSLYLGTMFIVAAGDLPTVAAGDLHRGFIGWLSHGLGAVEAQQFGT